MPFAFGVFAWGVFAWGVFAWVFLRIDRVFLRISADFFKYAAKSHDYEPTLKLKLDEVYCGIRSEVDGIPLVPGEEPRPYG